MHGHNAGIEAGGTVHFAVPFSTEPAVLASVPNLSELHAPFHRFYAHLHEPLAAWCMQLAALRPDVRITL